MIFRLPGMRTIPEIEETIVYGDDPYRMFGLARKEVKQLLEAGGLEVAEICEMERPGVRLQPIVCQTEIPYYRNAGKKIERRLKLFVVATEKVEDNYTLINFCQLPDEVEVLGAYFNQFGWECKACLEASRNTKFYSVKKFGDYTVFLELGSVEGT